MRPRFLLGLFALGACAHVRPIDRAAWTTDLDSLLTHIPVAYANFEYSVRTAGLKPDSLQAAARARIAKAHTEAGGRAAIAGLLDAFGDYHVSLRNASAPPSSSDGNERYASCKQLGFRNRDRTFHSSIRDQPGFSADEGGALPTARIAMPEGVVRVLRIPLFSQTQFPGLCETLWPRFAATDGGCDDPCTTALFAAVGDAALNDVASRLSGAAPPALLVVDITGNGGGSEWVVDVARQLTPRPLRLPSVGMVRHAHHRAAVGRRLTRDSASQWLLAELNRPCDWSGVWRGGPTPACSPLVIDSGKVLDAPPRPIWNGRVLILTDRATASASEEFAAVLVDAGVARVAGERTMGIGCGFTNGGIDFRLPRSGLAVRLPDCARFRKDGTNERAGIRPDVGAWSEGDDGAARARKLGEALREMTRP